MLDVYNRIFTKIFKNPSLGTSSWILDEVIWIHQKSKQTSSPLIKTTKFPFLKEFESHKWFKFWKIEYDEKYDTTFCVRSSCTFTNGKKIINIKLIVYTRPASYLILASQYGDELSIVTCMSQIVYSIEVDTINILV